MTARDALAEPITTPILRRYGVTLDDVRSKRRTPEDEHDRKMARQHIIAGLLREGWEYDAIGEVVGIAAHSVRRWKNHALLGVREPKHVRSKPEPPKRSLPVFAGPTLVAGEGDRRDCGRDDRGECSTNAVRLHSAGKVPLPDAWHCPDGCAWFEEPKRRTREYDATRSGVAPVW